MRSRMRHDMTVALKGRDEVTVAALRSAIAAIDNAEAVDTSANTARDAGSQHIAGATAGVGSSDVERRVLSDAEVQGIIRRQIQERREAADQYEKLGRRDRAMRLRREAVVLSEYLAG